MNLNLPQQLIGTWTLEAFEIESPDGTVKPWGQNTHGLLIYTNTGHLSVSINRDVVQKSENEFEKLFDSILFYSGTYKIENNVIRHQVTEASNPNRIGKEMIRYAEIKEDIVTLTTPKESFGIARLIWKKMK